MLPGWLIGSLCLAAALGLAVWLLVIKLRGQRWTYQMEGLASSEPLPVSSRRVKCALPPHRLEMHARSCRSRTAAHTVNGWSLCWSTLASADCATHLYVTAEAGQHEFRCDYRAAVACKALHVWHLQNT